MTDEELLAFIRRIREMCGGDRTRMKSALSTLRAILERQHDDDAKIDLMSKLQGDYEIHDLNDSSTPLNQMSDLHDVIDRAGRQRRIDDEAHRGCR